MNETTTPARSTPSSSTSRHTRHRLTSDMEATLRATYDGSAALVARLADRYGVSQYTIRTWANRLGLTRRSRPRPYATQTHQPASTPTWQVAIAMLEQPSQTPLAVLKGNVNSMELYLHDMGQFRCLTLEEEQILGQRSTQGDLEARWLLVLSNLRLVVRIARWYAKQRHPGLDIADLIQEGTFGLLHAATVYDAQRGYRFSTSATWWIRQAIHRAIHDQGRTIRLPVNVHEQLHRLKQLQHDDEQELTPVIIAQLLSISLKKAYDLLSASTEINSLDAPLDPDVDDRSLGELLPSPLDIPDQEVERDDLRTQLIRLLDTLTPRERAIIVWRFDLDGQGERTLEEVGKALKITRERVRQLEQRLLLQLRHEAKERQLQEYLSA